MPENTAEINYPSQYVEVLGSKIHYIEHGSGDPILFLHTVPASSYSWRNIIPFLAPLGCCIAVDLIGMGKSAKPDIAYTIEDHIHYIEEFIRVKNLKNITLVMHGWGSLIGCHYAVNHEDNCKGLIFYESFLRPLQGNDLSLPFQEQLLELRRQEETLSVAAGTYWIDKIFLQSMMHPISSEMLKHYRQPYEPNNPDALSAEKALKQYLNELPKGDGKGKIDNLIENYSKKLTQSQLAKLLLFSVPGFITTIPTIMWAKENLPKLEVGDLGEELHFAQEAYPQLMGELMSAWLQAVEQQTVI
ncbi:MAG TPA: haloalkane dehalogenase [Gammaproteobacteria bacterium]|nr:haloalkane dehalogenase [Gammaproteobacteria bacterium]